MTQPITLNLQAKQAPSLKQTQRMIMSPQMQQAIHLLQMPVLEITATLEEELQQNPIIDCLGEEEDENSSLKKLEEDNAEQSQDKEQTPEKELTFDENDFEILKKLDEDFRDHFTDFNSYSTHRTAEEDKLRTFQENSICAESSLFEYLMNQAKESFSEKELPLAEALIGSFDEKGFLHTSLQEISLLNNFPLHDLERLLKEIQTFEPYGIGASSMQESLLIQLRCKQKDKTLAYKIIEEHYEDLIHNRIPSIKKNLECTPEDISLALKKDISHLDLHPGVGHFKHFVQYITPDGSIEDTDSGLCVKINDDYIPSVRINRRYLRMLDDETLPAETKDFIRQKLIAARWLLKNVHQRNETLQKILELLIKFQKDFFINPHGQLAPLTMKSVAEELNLHESTIARAVANKYIDTPRGILPLRSFFTNALMTQRGEDVSPNTVKNILKELIQNEDKLHPLSDAVLSQILHEKGIHCARRTVAKYRVELNLGNAQQRRHYTEK